MKIYDISGRLVRTLVDGPQKIGYYREIWDGRDNRGSRVASGIYFLRFDTEAQRKTFNLVKISR